MNSRLVPVISVVVALLVGAGGGFAFGANRSDDGPDNCQEAAQQLYDALYTPDPDTATAFKFTDDYCPIDQIDH